MYPSIARPDLWYSTRAITAFRAWPTSSGPRAQIGKRQPGGGGHITAVDTRHIVTTEGCRHEANLDPTNGHKPRLLGCPNVLAHLLAGAHGLPQ